MSLEDVNHRAKDAGWEWFREDHDARVVIFRQTQRRQQIDDDVTTGTVNTSLTPPTQGPTP